MSSFQSALAQKALTATLAESPISIRADYNSRTADKFVFRANRAVLNEVDQLAKDHRRSTNSELIAAVLDGLSDHSPSRTMLAILKDHLGDKADQVLADVPALEARSDDKRQTIIRLPASVRQRIEDAAGVGFMNRWVAKTVTAWVVTQRQCDALLSACMLNQVTE